jgi:hypothetical protein
MAPAAQLLLPPTPVGFLLQWTLGAIVCCDPKLTGKESVYLTPHPLWCLLFMCVCVGGVDVKRYSWKPVILLLFFAFVFPVLGPELRPSCKHSLLSNTPRPLQSTLLIRELFYG